MVAYLNAELAKFMSHKSHRQEIIHLKATLYKKKTLYKIIHDTEILVLFKSYIVATKGNWQLSQALAWNIYKTQMRAYWYTVSARLLKMKSNLIGCWQGKKSCHDTLNNKLCLKSFHVQMSQSIWCLRLFPNARDHNPHTGVMQHLVSTVFPKHRRSQSIHSESCCIWCPRSFQSADHNPYTVNHTTSGVEDYSKTESNIIWALKFLPSFWYALKTNKIFALLIADYRIVERTYISKVLRIQEHSFTTTSLHTKVITHSKRKQT